MGLPIDDRMRRNLGKNLAIAATALAVSLFVAELVVRAFVPVRNVGPSFSVYDPIYGRRLKKSFSTERITPEFTMRFSTNERGFRGPELADPRAPSILFLGDSFTMGYGVNDGEEYPRRVARALTARGPASLTVVNAGVGNSGNGRWLKFLREEASRYRPELVVLQMHRNDFGDNLMEGLFALAPDGELRELPVPPPGPLRTLQSVIEMIPGLDRSYLVGLAKQLPEVSVAPLGTRGERLTLRILEAVLRVCETSGWPVVGLLVDMPDSRRVPLDELFAARGIPAVAMPTKLERPDIYYEADGHWRPSGHALAASRLLEVFDRRGLLGGASGSTGVRAADPRTGG